MVIKTAIVEDDKVAFENIKALLERYGQEKNQDFNIQYFSDGQKFLNEFKLFFDVVFMDIQMPILNGFEASKKMRDIDPVVSLIFVTDLAQYAIKGYEVDAYDFIVKPVVYEHLSMKLDKLCRILSERKKEPKMTIKVEEGLIALSPSNIKYIEIMDHRLYYHTDKGVYNAYGSLNDVEKNLPKDTFVRCNHCYLVNLAYVVGIDKYEVVLGKERLQISHPKKKAFLEAFTEYLGRHS